MQLTEIPLEQILFQPDDDLLRWKHVAISIKISNF